MHRACRLVAAAALGALLIVPASLAQAQEGAQKVPLEHLRNVDCQGHQLSPGVGTNGFALIHENGSRMLIAEVALKNALPNTTYNVRLIQTPSGADCGVFDGTLTTNSEGNGNTNIQEPALLGTTDAFVDVSTTGFTDFYTTPDVTVS